MDQNCAPETQICGRCGLEKPISEFSRNKARKNGRSHLCKECERLKNKANYEKHSESRRNYAAQYREEHKEEKSDYNKAYRKENRDALILYTRNWRKTNKANRSPESLERQRLSRTERYANDSAYRERIKEKTKAYRDSHPGKVRDTNKRWREANREHVREYLRNYLKTWKTPEEKKQYEKEVRARRFVKIFMDGAVSRSKRSEIPGEFSNEHLYWLFKWQDNCCFFCNTELNSENNHDRPVDHLIPVIIPGASNWPHNIVRSCGHCNYTRQDKLFSMEWKPEKIVSPTRFHSAYCLSELKREIANRGIDYEDFSNHISINGIPIFMLSTFWMSSRTTPIETLETVRAKHQSSILFFDHEWTEKKNALMNILLAKIGTADRIGARELEIDVPTFDEAKEFTNKWHIQGFAGGTWIVGLRVPGKKDQNSWRAMAIFRNTKHGYELSRMTFRSHVPGGLSRILSAFNKLVPEKRQIFSFCDLRFGEGGGYLATGFQSTGDSAPVTAYANNVGFYHWYIAKRQNLERRLDYYNPDLSEIENLRVNGIFRMTLLPRKKFIMPV